MASTILIGDAAPSSVRLPKAYCIASLSM
eukprot:COSAG01_NODE_28294_length_664_cov_2.107965_2_plen_28_part_01